MALKTILERLNGAAADPAAISAALDHLGHDRIQAEAALDALKVERRAALLNDADDRALDLLERRIERAELKAEKLAVAEEPLRQRLAEAQAAARRERLEEFRRTIAPQARRLVAAARALIAENDAYTALVSQMAAEGFAAERASMAAVPPLLGDTGNFVAAATLVDVFEREAERLATAPLPLAPATASGPAVPGRVAISVGEHFQLARPSPAAAIPQRPREVVLSKPNIAPPQRRPERKSLPEIADGVRVLVLRSGLEAHGEQLTIGDETVLPRASAIEAAKQGAVELIAEGNSA